ncbi:hypothetical protein SDC9_132597 [bioreactor metagenome]|uniref:MOFRL domain-containing protein n=1 Tax=bioreactor metagenome TaxID=1076179 RepID=A0A645D818_9ZZZZ
MDVIGRQNMPELTQKFEELYGFKPGNTTPRGIRKRISYRLQEIYLGGLSDRDIETLEAVADKDPLANLDQRGTRKVINREGTRLKRVWKGVEHVVIAGIDTDGTDGVSNLAGGMVDCTTAKRAKEKNIDIYNYVSRFDDSVALRALDDGVLTGATGTNVNDLKLMVVDLNK